MVACTKPHAQKLFFAYRCYLSRGKQRTQCFENIGKWKKINAEENWVLARSKKTILRVVIALDVYDCRRRAQITDQLSSVAFFSFLTSPYLSHQSLT